jgi:hypothetical protein
MFVSGNAFAGAPKPPVPTPALPPPADVVPNPTEGQQAIGALRILLPDGAAPSGPLLLRVAGSAPAPPTTALKACRLVLQAFQPGGNQPWPQRPAYDCDAGSAAGKVADDGKSISFDVGGLVSTGLLVVAIIPGGASDQVAFDAPGDDALPVTTGAGVTSGETAPDVSPVVPTEPVPAAAPDVSASPLPSSAPSQQAAPVVPGGGPSTRRSTPRPTAAVAATHDLRDRLLGGLFALAFLAALMVVYRQDSGRMPNLLGGLARRTPATAAAPPVDTRGIGRFARPRTGQVPRL